MATTVLNFENDVRGNNTFAPQFSTNKYSSTLMNGVEATFTIPANYPHWVISIVPGAGGNIWVANNQSAALPADDTFTATNSELNPGPRAVFANDVIHVLTDQTTCDVSVIMYAVT